MNNRVQPFEIYLGMVEDVGDEYAIVRDSFGRRRDIRLLPRRGGGPLPRVGELWIIDRVLGEWSFSSLLKPAPIELTGEDRGNLAVRNIAEALESMGLVINNLTAGGDLYQGFTYGGTLEYDTDGTFEKADYPGLRAVKIAGEFILADDLSDSEVIRAGMGGSNDHKLLGRSVADGTNISWPAISVPQTHRDLEIRWRASHLGSGIQPILLRFTGAGANTDHRFATKYIGPELNSTTVVNLASGNNASRITIGQAPTSDLTAGGVVHIPNYTVAGSAVPLTYQSWATTGTTNGYVTWGAGFYLGGAITQISANCADTLESGSTISVYGLGKKATDVELWF